ncbi:MAG: hypothetical protein Q4G14_14475 [Paracoccus sp. (in: a-proteobacteria)]|uniref:hypothetical protein n=1 Tax=Paracoccus sp. TaxID=267 RepID=UPI0026DF70C0|nr:hypothetical protein [Paracoccus sp. (in: a-proteobacteria)]MDO5614433.1 hypothetical protein [Paracoccus sp. (in: a-proteobacteria)]
MLGPLRAALSVVLIPAMILIAGFWAGVEYQARRGLAAEHVALVEQARVIEEMLHDAARRAAERRVAMEILQQELADYEAQLDGVCRIDGADLERLRGF